MTILKRNNVRLSGDGDQIMLFAHGFGCDQHMWRLVAPAFEQTHRVALFDHVGAGNSDLNAYRPAKYRTLGGYAQDVLEVADALNMQGGIFVGHSVSAMIGILAAIQEPKRFEKLVLIGPSPCYINDGDYIGGFERADIEELLEFMDTNYLGWSSMLAPAIMGNVERPELTDELENSFCRTDPNIAKQFARTTFLSDNRADVPRVQVPALILQCSADIIAPLSVGEYMHRHLPESTLVVLQAIGHCPHLSAPQETIIAVKTFL